MRSLNFRLLKEGFDDFVRSTANDVFSQIDATVVHVIDQDKKELDELLGDESPENKHLYKTQDPERLKKIIAMHRDSPGTKTAQKKMGYVHRKYMDVVAIKTPDGETYDLDKLKSLIKQRPKQMLIQNEKMQHGSIGTVKFFNIGLPALKSLVVNEKTDELVLVNTCPGAGACVLDCYALKGQFLLFKDVGMSRAQRLNFLVNDPEGFKSRLVHELSTKLKSLKKDGIKVVLRWHDAGDFFAEEYLQMAIDIANICPEIEFYGYTKRANVVTANLPDNLTMRFSEEAAGVEIDKVKDQNVRKAVIVPLSLFKDLFVMGKNGRPERTNKDDSHWIYIPPEKKSIKILKQRIADTYNIDVNTLFTHDEFMNNKSLHKGIEPKYNVIIRPGDSDYPAKMKTVQAAFNLEH